MARLTSRARNSLSSSQFAGPNRSFPINDKVHQEKAIQLAPRSERAGNISAGTEKRIVSRARSALRRGR